VLVRIAFNRDALIPGKGWSETYIYLTVSRVGARGLGAPNIKVPGRTCTHNTVAIGRIDTPVVSTASLKRKIISRRDRWITNIIPRVPRRRRVLEGRWAEVCVLDAINDILFILAEVRRVLARIISRCEIKYRVYVPRR